MKKLLFVLLAGMAVMLAGCTSGTIETGNVGVQTRWGKVNPVEEQPGFYFQLFASMQEATAKEVSIDLKDQKPRAKDNLYLKDLDATVYYTTAPDRVAEFLIAKQGQSGQNGGLVYPGFLLVQRLAAGAIGDQVSKFDSLTMHQQREALEKGIQRAVQMDLDADAAIKGTFTVTRVVISSLQTDDSIEKSIQANVQRDKELEAKVKEIDIAKKSAQVAIENTKGIAASNDLLNRTLTKEFLEHERNVALQKCAEKGSGCTLIIGGGVPLLNVGK